MTKKANRVVGVIRRSFDYLSDPMFVQLFKALVRPIVEYGNSAWHPYQKELQQEIEDVQRRATKLLGHLKDKPYHERLAALKLPSLEHRRKRGAMIDCYKYVHEIYRTNRPQFKQFTAKNVRGHSLKLAKNHHRLQIRGNFFSERVINVWNSLPDNVVTAPTVNTFKSRLDSHWKNLVSVYKPDCYN